MITGVYIMTEKEMTINESVNIGPLLKELRKKRKITQVELAEFSGLSRTGIVKLESGEGDIKISTLINIVNLLGLDLVLKKRGLR
jgi:transcriptional regulator with XRE-family HTH domain